LFGIYASTVRKKLQLFLDVPLHGICFKYREADHKNREGKEKYYFHGVNLVTQMPKGRILLPSVSPSQSVSF